MSPVHRPMTGDILAFDLAEEMQFVTAELSAGHARIARTLVKDGVLRLTLVGLSAGGAMHEHESAGPISIHVLNGEVELVAPGGSRTCVAGTVVALDGRVRHSVSSSRGALFLLTLAAPTATPESH